MLSFIDQNSGNSQIMGKKKRGSNRQNPGPSERTSQDQNFAQAVKTLFRIIQCIHHFAIANNQLNGTVTKSFEAKLSDLNKFVKPACPTASLAQQIDLINSMAPGHHWKRGGTLQGEDWQFQTSTLHV